jgi:hypothetical protein
LHCAASHRANTVVAVASLAILPLLKFKSASGEGEVEAGYVLFEKRGCPKGAVDMFEEGTS